MDRGREFAAEVQDTTRKECGTRRKLMTTRNPQANAMVKRVHQTIHNMIASMGIRSQNDLDKDFGWTGVLAAI